MEEEPAKKSVSYFFSEDVGVYASVEAMLLKPHILKCAKRSAGDYTSLPPSLRVFHSLSAHTHKSLTLTSSCPFLFAQDDARSDQILQIA